MKIFVTGGSGYIGEAVAIALRTRGHEVYGLVRSEEKGKNLLINEVNVVVGDISKPETYKEVASKCGVLIHTAFDFTNFGPTDEIATNALMDAAKHGKKLFIYTSGILVCPPSDTKDGLKVWDEDEPTDPNVHPILKGRTVLEQRVINNRDIHGVVIRPSFVYGKKGTYPGAHFKQALEGKVVLKAKPSLIHSQVHIDDTANAYVKVVEASPNVVGGHIFNIGDDSRTTDLQIVTAAARATGFKGEIEIDEKSAFDFINKSVLVSSRKATRILGWTPLHLGGIDDIDTIYRSWKAQQ